MPFTPDTNAIPVSGDCQWQEGASASFTANTQFQSLFNVRASSTSNRLLFLNNSATAISFTAAAKVMFAGTWANVTVGGSTTITIPAYSSVQTDVFAASLTAGQFVYVRTFHVLSTATVFPSGFVAGGNNPEGITPTGGFNFVMGSLTGLSASRLLEGGTTFEAALSGAYQAFIGQSIFAPYGVVGIPTVAGVRLTTFIGDSKTQNPYGDVAFGAGWANLGMGIGSGGPYHNLAQSGDTMAGFLATDGGNTLRRELLKFGGDYVNHYAANDLNSSEPTASLISTFEANSAAIRAAIAAVAPAGYRYYVVVPDAHNSLTGGGAWPTVTPAQQVPTSAAFGVTPDPYVTLYNLLTAPGGAAVVSADGILKLNGGTCAVVNGALVWLTDGVNGYTADGVHETNLGNQTQGAAFAAVWPIPVTSLTVAGTLTAGQPFANLAVTAANLTPTTNPSDYTPSGGSVTSVRLSGGIAYLSGVAPTVDGTWTVTFGGVTSNAIGVTSAIAAYPAVVQAGPGQTVTVNGSGLTGRFTFGGTANVKVYQQVSGVTGLSTYTLGVNASTVGTLTITDAAGPSTTVTFAAATPGGLAVVAFSGGATATWAASAGAATYQLLQNGTAVANVNAASPLTATVTGLANGTAYAFTVTATDAAGNVSPPAGPVTVTPVVADPFAGVVGAGLNVPYTNDAAVTPSDTVDLPFVSRAILPGTAGALKVQLQGAAGPVVLTVAAGVVLPVRATRVYATGTTATGIVALV